MKNILNIVGVLLIVTLTACSKPGVEISQQEYGAKWPFTVSGGRLECINNAVIFHAGEKAYAVNGVAKQKGYSAIEVIWKEDPSFFKMAEEIAKSENKAVKEVINAMGSPTRINIGPILDRGLALCK